MNKYYTIAKNNDLHTPIEIFSSIDLAKDKAREYADKGYRTIMKKIPDNGRYIVSKNNYGYKIHDARDSINDRFIEYRIISLGEIENLEMLAKLANNEIEKRRGSKTE